jgi:hypothetical protein
MASDVLMCLLCVPVLVLCKVGCVDAKLLSIQSPFMFRQETAWGRLCVTFILQSLLKEHEFVFHVNSFTLFNSSFASLVAKRTKMLMVVAAHYATGLQT